MRLPLCFPLTTFVSLARYPRHQIGHWQVSSLFVLLRDGPVRVRFVFQAWDSGYNSWRGGGRF